jgi:AcrR family transcriptional regulator
MKVETQGGRGARERILRAASELFYNQGINATGVEQLAEVAHVSKRTLYQHFGSKDDVVVAYLDAITYADLGPSMAMLDRTDLSPRERLLGIFTPDAELRGCPYLNASAELADTEHPARLISQQRKQLFIDRLIAVAGEAGARDRDELGHQLALLSDGARSQSAALNSSEPFGYARAAASAMIELGVS